MKKLTLYFCICCLVAFAFVGINTFCNQSFASVQKVRITVDNIPIYSRQDFLDINKSERETALLQKARLHQIFTVSQEYDKVYGIYLDENQNTVGYVLKSMTIDNSISSPQKSLNYNAEILADANTFEKLGDEYKMLETVLKKGDKVCILNGYNQNSQYTFVSFYSGDVLLNCYVKTEVLKVPGVSSTLIVSLSVLVAGCTIAIVLTKLVVGKQKKIKSKNM